MALPPQLGYFNTGEVAIHYAEWPADTAGQGQPAYLFIHGITGRHETWYEVVDQIRQGARAVAVDLRGHGRSGHVTGRYMLPDYARDMAVLTEGLGLDSPIIIGHSLGAMTTLQLASVQPDLARAIVLEDPPLFAVTIMEIAPERHERFGRNAQLAAVGYSIDELAQIVREADPEAAEEAVQKSALSLFITDPDAIFHVYDERIFGPSNKHTSWSEEIESVLGSVRCPTLLMQGNFELGAWMTGDDGKRAEELIAECTLEVWDDTGHGLHSENPERFLKQVNRFLAGLKTAART